MSLLEPIPPPYDPLDWDKRPFPEKTRMVCEAWALQGYGAPLAVFFAYALKVGLFIGGWIFFCRFTPGLGTLRSFDVWWLSPIAFQKAIAWSMLFEVLGLGCGSGPLTGRYFPPFGGFLHFLRPGTTKLPLLRGVPIVGGHRRTLLDVLLYAGLLAALLWLLVQATPGFSQFLAVVCLLAVLGLFDKTIFLAARAEHYFSMMVCFLFTPWIAGAKIVQLGLWFWAGVSKLNRHFPMVVCVMTSNSPLLRFAWLRKLMYRNFPDDLRPSWLASVSGHLGTSLEFGVPIILAVSVGGLGTEIGLVLMLILHVYITSNVPMGVPIEWNFVMVYGAFFLFYQHASVEVLAVQTEPLLVLFVLVMVVVLPLLGNVFPNRISFLMAMRYYAGNWAFSAWMFRRGSHEKIERNITKSSKWIYDQLGIFYDYATSVGMVGKVLAFRAMHLHGRTLQTLVPKAVDDPTAYEYVDGELIAGLTLGWNFGDGHLHDERLLDAVQKQCSFEPGELRCIFVESQPIHRRSLNYRIVDASTGVVETGTFTVDELLERQPWGESI